MPRLTTGTDGQLILTEQLPEYDSCVGRSPRECEHRV